MIDKREPLKYVTLKRGFYSRYGNSPEIKNEFEDMDFVQKDSYDRLARENEILRKCLNYFSDPKVYEACTILGTSMEIPVLVNGEWIARSAICAADEMRTGK